jgi:glucose-1-phosphatase
VAKVSKFRYLQKGILKFMANLKNIIFDLGGVLLNIDYYKTENAFKELGFTQFEEMYNQYKSDVVFSQLEKGTISNEDFYSYMIQTGEGKINSEQIEHAWNAMLLDFREESLSFLVQLAKKYKIFLLSNTNAIHLHSFSAIFQKQTGHASLDNYFTKAYYSHQVGLRKPDEDIFEYVLNDAQITAAESLFIDDSFNNINTAKNMGFATHLLLPGEKVEALACLR